MPSEATKPDKARGEFSLTVSRALSVLATFSSERPTLGLAEISRDVGVSKQSALRFLQALMMHGFVDQDPKTKLYRPGYEAFRIGDLVRSERGLEKAALPRLRQLSEACGFTSYLSVIRNDRMLILASVSGSGPLLFAARVGETLPVPSTATGQAALACMSDDEVAVLIKRTGLPRVTQATPTTMTELTKRIREIRTRNFAVSWEQNLLGIASVASAVAAPDGELRAVISIGFATSQVKKSECAKLGDKVRATSRAIASDLVNFE